jgi:hypothetical protein
MSERETEDSFMIFHVKFPAKRHLHRRLEFFFKAASVADCRRE